MTQIIYRATTATTIAAGTSITTGNVQMLPAWAPPIAYIGTTDPWLVNFIISTTQAGGGAGVSYKGKISSAKVRAYGRRSTLQSGVEVFATAKGIKQATNKTRPAVMYLLTYRALGEIVRP